jgi:hypothetical protein
VAGDGLGVGQLAVHEALRPAEALDHDGAHRDFSQRSLNSVTVIDL